MIVIGDVHGRYDLLMKLFDKLPQTKDICFVGDLIDRGPDSKKVVDFIIKNNYNSVIGNHEDMLVKAYDSSLDPAINKYFYNIWMENGGYKTLQSFNNDIKDYIDFFENLPLFIEIEYKNETVLISHSYAYNGDKTPEDDILWGRCFAYQPQQNFTNIFGHTPLKTYPICYHNKHWCIDTGAVYYGHLTAYDLKLNVFYQSIEKKEG